MTLSDKKPTMYVYSLSVCLILIGSTACGYSYLLYPSLVPMYGGGEQFYLNDYTEQFLFSSTTKLHITMNANKFV